MTHRIEHLAEGVVTLHCGDCLGVLKTLEADSVDAGVTDPPYGLEFMGKSWDSFKTGRAAKYASGGKLHDPEDRRGKGGAGPAYTSRSAKRCRKCGKQAWSGSPCTCAQPDWEIDHSPLYSFQAFNEAWAREVFRVLKPGAHLLAFGGTRTYHRMACAIEDAGFEIRDSIQWLYGSGFPKSLDVSKAIDKAAGEQRERIRGVRSGIVADVYAQDAWSKEFKDSVLSSEPITEDAREWQGYGTALKPACEPIVLARKPLSESTVAANVLKWGTGALNIDGCRVTTDENLNGGTYSDTGRVDEFFKNKIVGAGEFKQPPGRWPANVIHDGSDEVVGVFPDAPGQQRYVGPEHGERPSRGIYGDFGARPPNEPRDDGGSAARFFYTAKADADDRLGSKHPTVKPLDLMQYLVRLVTPPKGLCLDPFAGTGTTGEACIREGMRAILIEKEEEYQDDIRRRMRLAMTAGLDERARESAKARNKDKPLDHGPLFGAQP